MNNYMTSRLQTWRKWTDGPLLVVAIGSLPVLLLEFVAYRLSDGDLAFIRFVNILVLVAFAVDYVVEFALAKRHGSYVKHEWTTLLIVLAQAITLFSGGGVVGVVRVLRVGRAWRALVVVVRVVAIGGASARDGRALLRRYAARLALSVAGFTLLTSAAAFTIAEDVGKHGHWHSFFDALWWSTATMTTVGSDIQPVTAVGRMIAVVTMLAGIAAASIITAKVAEVLVRIGREEAAAAQQAEPFV